MVIPDQCAALGVKELVIFDPKMTGPKARGGPQRIQVWRRTSVGFERVHAGEGPFPSEHLGAFVLIVENGALPRVADDQAGLSLWPTGEERERAEKLAERAERERALERVAELEAELRSLGEKR